MQVLVAWTVEALIRLDLEETDFCNDLEALIRLDLEALFQCEGQ